MAYQIGGSVIAWGDNSTGQLASFEVSDSATPLYVDGIDSVKSISCGYNFVLALKTDGTVWGWGYNRYGELGDGTSGSSNYKRIPVKSFAENVRSVSAGFDHSLVLKNDGTVWAFGYNNKGQLGNDTTSLSTTPVQVLGLTDVVDIAAGYGFSLAVKSDGTVWGWGTNGSGSLWNGGDSQFNTTPVQIVGLSDIESISAGSGHILAVKKSTSAVIAWGNNDYGQLGNGGAAATPDNPTEVSGVEWILNNSTYLAAVVAGSNHSLGLKNNGVLFTWGVNNSGQLGFGDYDDRNTATKIPQENTYTIYKIAGGWSHTVALDNNRVIRTWGSNAFGELGRPTDSANSPVAGKVTGF